MDEISGKKPCTIIYL